jgi:hypothetical protein
MDRRLTPATHDRAFATVSTSYWSAVGGYSDRTDRTFFANYPDGNRPWRKHKRSGAEENEYFVRDGAIVTIAQILRAQRLDRLVRDACTWYPVLSTTVRHQAIEVRAASIVWSLVRPVSTAQV